MHFKLHGPIIIWGDNSGSVLNANIDKSSKKLNYLNAQDYIIQDCTATREIIVQGVNTKLQLADIFTKR